MERLAIIDHSTHTLYVEDVSEKDLERYNGEEEDYIRDNYTFEGDFSWDWVTEVLHTVDGDCYELELPADTTGIDEFGLYVNEVEGKVS